VGQQGNSHAGPPTGAGSDELPTAKYRHSAREKTRTRPERRRDVAALMENRCRSLLKTRENCMVIRSISK